MGSPIQIFYPKEYYVMQCHTQTNNITTNLKVQIDFTLPELSEKIIVTCDFHVDDSAKGRYDMILGRYILKALGFNVKLSEHDTKSDYGPLKGSSALMINLGTYEFINLNTGKYTPKE